MKLADWLFQNSLSPEQLRRKLGVKNRSTVTRWLADERLPSVPWLHRINKLTSGAVTKADFKSSSPPQCAAIVLDEVGEPRYVFPWSRGTKQHDAALASLVSEPKEGDRLSNPVVLALTVLGRRAKLTDSGVFLLDGRPSDARRIVAAANRELMQAGKTGIPYPTVQRREP